MSFTIFAVRYVRIQQEALLESFSKLIAEIDNKNENKSNSYSKLHWENFCRLNRKLILLCRTVEEYSRYCAPFLNVIFPYHITVQCYTLYIITFVEGFPPSQLAIMYMTVVECNLFLFVCMHECAVIVKHNGAFERLSRNFVFEFNIRKGRGQGGVSLSQLIKTDSLMASKRLYRYSFKLISNYRITSKMYYTVRKSGLLLFKQFVNEFLFFCRLFQK